MRGLGLARVDPTRDKNRLLLAVVLEVVAQPLAEASEEWAGRQEVVLVVLEEALDLLLEGRLEESLHPPLGVFSLPREFLGLLVLLPKCLLHNVGNLVHEPHLLVVVEIGTYVLGDGDEWHRSLTKGVAKDIHLHIRVVGLVLSHFSETLLHVCVSIRDRVREPDFIVNTSLKLVGEAESVVKIDSLSSSVVVQQELVIALLISLHLFGWLRLVLIPRNLVLYV